MKHRTLLGRLLAVGAIVVLAFVGVLMWEHYARFRVTVATADQITAEVASMKRSKGYAAGGRYLAALERQGVSPDQKNLLSQYGSAAVNVRLLADFAGSLTSKQVEIMGRMGGLPLASLGPDQRKLVYLLHRCSSFRDKYQESDIPHSVFLFSRQSTGFIDTRWNITRRGGSVFENHYGLGDSTDLILEAERGRTGRQ